jgi:predicted nucleotidyltransferase
MSVGNHVLLKELNQLLKARFPNEVVDVVLFGSQVSGHAQKGSDYDILIILKHKADWKIEREISDLCYEIELKFDIITDIHIIGETELPTLRGKQPIFVNAISNGLHV